MNSSPEQLERRVSQLERFLEAAMATERIHEEIKADWRILKTLCDRVGISTTQATRTSHLPHLVEARRSVVLWLVELGWNDSRIARTTLMTPEGVKKVREAKRKTKPKKDADEGERFGV